MMDPDQLLRLMREHVSLYATSHTNIRGQVNVEVKLVWTHKIEHEFYIENKGEVLSECNFDLEG